MINIVKKRIICCQDYTFIRDLKYISAKNKCKKHGFENRL